MKKVLILTYYFPPCTATAGYRPLAWANDLHRFGWFPTVVTRHWKEGAGTREDFVGADERPAEVDKTDSHMVIRLPYAYTKKRWLGEKVLARLAPVRKLYYLVLTMFGEFNIDMDAYTPYHDYLVRHLNEERYDAIIATVPPFSLLRLAKMLSKRYAIPYVADFRDLWNNEEMKIGFRYPKSEKFKFAIMCRYVRKWLWDSKLILVTRPTFREPVLALLGKPARTEVLLNGYEEKFYHDLPPMPPNDRLTIACVGTLYPEQDLGTFAEGFTLFIREHPGAKIIVKFVGVGVVPEVERLIKATFPAAYVATMGRLPRDRAIQETIAADVLYYPAWRGYTGVIATKIFDYMASRRNLLIAPGDGSSIDELVSETRSGAICNDARSVSEQLSAWYKEWTEQGTLNYYGKEEQIRHYSRERQTEYLASLLEDIAMPAL